MNKFLKYGEKMNSLLPEINFAIDKLHKNGYKAYLIGGSIRDYIMGKNPDDFDITTDALPEETKACFSEYKCVETGIKHGTITVIINSIPIEITTFRFDGDYSDHRHPQKVKFSSSLFEDTSRRDFKINAIAYNEKEGFLDFHGGIEDIKNKKIKCIGDADKRFNEDALRIMRAVRFSSTLGFEIEENTKKAIFKNKDLLSFVSKERIFIELKKTLCGDFIENILSEYVDIFSVIIPELSLMKGFDQKNPHHIFDILHHTARVIKSIEKNEKLRLAALFHDIGKPFCFSTDENGIGHFYGHNKISANLTEKALKNLKADTKTINDVTTLVLHHDAPITPDEKTVKRRLNKLGEEIFFDLIKLQAADNMGLSPEYNYRQETYKKLSEIGREILEKEECFSLKNLAINGNDLISLGYKGKEIGEILNYLLSVVIDGKEENNKEKLLLLLEKAKSTE